ncbi:MAG: 16S rRNA (cytidine(1402)-2'-O)-methyltransferase [bacterium]
MEKNNFQAGIYLVPTPIGNLDDITIRAMKLLKAADIIACEDTRTTGQLLKLLEIDHRRMVSFHEHNETQRSEELVKAAQEGSIVALVSDAGSPGISDPGFRLINFARQSDVYITALPGATALIPALTASGFPTDAFAFLGFPPAKKGRKTFLESINKFDLTIILYESPHKIVKLIEEIINHYGTVIEVCIAREISKIYEEYIHGTADYVLTQLKNKPSIKGEFVVVINMKKYNKGNK